jgi:hypothetical protein
MTVNDPRDDPQYQVSGKGYEPKIKQDTTRADAKVVTEFHKKDDVDSSQEAHHHTLGPRHDQAAAGDHLHNGTSGRPLLKGTTITGSKGGNAALASVIAALVKLGATDSST